MSFVQQAGIIETHFQCFLEVWYGSELAAALNWPGHWLIRFSFLCKHFADTMDWSTKSRTIPCNARGVVNDWNIGSLKEATKRSTCSAERCCIVLHSTRWVAFIVRRSFFLCVIHAIFIHRHCRNGATEARCTVGVDVMDFCSCSTASPSLEFICAAFFLVRATIAKSSCYPHSGVLLRLKLLVRWMSSFFLLLSCHFLRCCGRGVKWEGT